MGRLLPNRGMVQGAKQFAVRRGTSGALLIPVIESLRSTNKAGRFVREREHTVPARCSMVAVTNVSIDPNSNNHSPSNRWLPNAARGGSSVSLTSFRNRSSSACNALTVSA